MKIIYLSICLIILTSCLSYPYVQKKDYNNFNKIETGKSYTFKTSDRKEHRFTVENINTDSIKGSTKRHSFALAKKEIVEIRKNRPLATIGLATGIIGGITAGLVMVSSAVGMKTE